MKSSIIRFAASHKTLASVIAVTITAIPFGIIAWLCGYKYGTFIADVIIKIYNLEVKED